MPVIEKPDSHLTTVKWRFPSVHPEGRKYVVIAAGVTLVTYMVISHFLGWLLVGVTIWVAAFFRDPIRTTPQDPKLVVVARRRAGDDGRQGARRRPSSPEPTASPMPR